jgi:hypothetical protein
MKNIAKVFIKSLSVIFFTLFLISFSFSASLELQKIGALETQGNNYPEWWYMGSSPVLSGVAESGEAVTIKINDDSYSVVPDDSGSWSYATQLENADYDIVISQGEETISFILHMGQAMPTSTGTAGETTQSTTSVPETGFNQFVALLFGLGVVLLATYFYFASESGGKKVFETRMLKED